MWILLRAPRRVGHADGVEQFDRAFLRRLAPRKTMYHQGFPNLESDRVDRVQGSLRFLEHESDSAPAHLPHWFFGQLEQVAAFEFDAAGSNTPGRHYKTND